MAFGKSFAPIKIGDEYNVKIDAVGEKGDGVAKVNGFVLFIPGAKEGEEVKVKVTKVLRKFGFAEVVGKADAPVETEEPASEEQPEAQPEEEPQPEEELPEESK